MNNNFLSDNSYEDLLNEYAGESLGNRSRVPSDDVKPVAPKKRVSTPAPPKKNDSAPVAYEEPVFNINTKRKTTPVIEDSFDVELIAPFEEAPIKPQPVIEKRYESVRKATPNRTSDTMEFSTKKGPKKPKKAKSKVEVEKEPKPKIFYIRDGKINIDGDAVKKRTLKALKKFRTFIIVIMCCSLVASIFATLALSCINDVLAINRDSEKVIEVILPNNATTRDAVKVLKDAGLIKNTLFCNFYLNLMGYSDENYLPGVYYFTANMGVEKMITRFKTSAIRGAVISVTIPEGYTIDQIFERLEKNDICTKAALYKTIDNVDFSKEYPFLKNLSNTKDRYHVLEGFMFPATYEFEQGADPATVIRKFLDAFNARWTDDYAARAKELGMSVDEIITIASIIEKEGANSLQFKLVSSVLHNRLNRSGLYPTLECNSTQDYVTNTVSKRVTSATELSAYIRNYSTYESAGLPPGAICNPGAAAIEAALYPDTQQYYFFRHDKFGKIYMAYTIEEHSANGRLVEKVNAED